MIRSVTITDTVTGQSVTTGIVSIECSGLADGKHGECDNGNGFACACLCHRPVIQVRAGGIYGQSVSYAEAVRLAGGGGQPHTAGLIVTAVSALTGEPVHGVCAEVRCRDTAYGQPRDAGVSIGGLGTHDTGTGRIRLHCYSLAIEIASAANAAAGVAVVPEAVPGTGPQRCFNCGARDGEECSSWCAYGPAGRPMPS